MTMMRRDTTPVGTVRCEQCSKSELLRTARTYYNKALRFVGEFDGTANDGEPVTFYMVYRGDCGWSMYQENAEWMGNLTEELVEASFDVYNSVELVDVSEIPQTPCNYGHFDIAANGQN